MQQSTTELKSRMESCPLPLPYCFKLGAVTRKELTAKGLENLTAHRNFSRVRALQHDIASKPLLRYGGTNQLSELPNMTYSHSTLVLYSTQPVHGSVLLLAEWYATQRKEPSWYRQG
ncbi:unnamed protein product [Ixodes persulcatus]